MTRELTAGILSFLAGASAVILWQKLRKEKNKNGESEVVADRQAITAVSMPVLPSCRTFFSSLVRTSKTSESLLHLGHAAGAVVPGEDLSLFYGDEQALRTVHDHCKCLDSDLYAAVVRHTVVCCVDIVLVRRNPESRRRECLLALRASEPAKGIWWWPGGRLLKGETFFDTAVRKAKQEAGLDASQVRPVQVLGVWNTFFPLSSWDTDQIKGTQTVNAIVLVEVILDDLVTDVRLDAQHDNFRWISLVPAENQEEDKYVLEALYRLEAWDPTYMHG